MREFCSLFVVPALWLYLKCVLYKHILSFKRSVSFHRTNFNCHLKNNPNEMVIKAQAGVTSGIRAYFCELDNSMYHQERTRFQWGCGQVLEIN